MPVVLALIEIYKLWHTYLPNIPKAARYTLGAKIDLAILEVAELAFTASAASKLLKIAPLQRAGSKVDLLKLLLRMAWEIRAIDSAKYSNLSETLDGVGRMIGGWLKQTQKETPRH